MRSINSNEITDLNEATVLTVGNFDGVHLGHRKLLDEVIRRAEAESMKSMVVTFDPHTRLVTQEKNGYKLLTTFEEKAKLIELAGIDYLVRVPFDTAMSAMEPEVFIKELLVQKLHMARWVLGQGHAIGRDRGGNENFLHIMEGKYHFQMFITDLFERDGNAVSSTQIRDFITNGRIAEAFQLLGHPYLISVEHTSGRKIGTKLGYPTLNFRSPPWRKVIPPPGVYAAELEFAGNLEEGALYYGDCPTLHEHREVHFEFYSFNRGHDEIAEGTKAYVWLYRFVRSDNSFAGTDALVRQITNDIETIKHYFTKEKVRWR